MTATNPYITTYHTTSASNTAALLPLLSSQDVAKSRTINHAERQAIFITGRALLATAIQQQAHQNAYQLDYNDSGKPLLRQPLSWHMNITHSQQSIYLTITQHSPCGVDSEIIKPRSTSRIIDSIFNATEQAFIAQADDTLLAFYTVWTRKEARVKYAGVSIFSDLVNDASLQIHSYQHQQAVLSICTQRSDLPTTYQFYHHDFDANTTQTFTPQKLTALID